jgi:hypothetical protein
VHRADDFLGVNALQIDAGDPEVGVSELSLDRVDRNSLSRHFHGVSMAQLMGSKAPPNTSSRRDSLEGPAS